MSELRSKVAICLTTKSCGRNPFGELIISSYPLSDLIVSTVYRRPFYNRVLTIINNHAGLKLEPEGQEGISIVRYGIGGQYR